MTLGYDSVLAEVAASYGLDVNGESDLNKARKNPARAKINGGLTVSQEDFCRYVANGTPLTAAYRKAFPNVTTSNQDTVYQRAYKLCKKDKIKERIDNLLKEREASAVNDYARIRQFVVDRLQLEAIDQKNSGSARVRALELLGRIDKIQLFAETSGEEAAATKASGDILTELQSRLTKLLGNSAIVDITPAQEIEDLSCKDEISPIK